MAAAGSGAAAGATGDFGLPAGRDAGSGGPEAAPGATPAGPLNPDCPAGALFCDDFESYPLGASLAPNWTTQLVNGQVQVETSRPHRGAKSVRLTTTLSPTNEPARTNGGPLRAATLIKEGAPLFPLPNNAFFGRAMIWLTQMPPGGVHFSNVEALGRLPDGTLAKYGEGGMYGKLLAGYTIRPMTELDQPTVDCSRSATTGLPEGRWVCLEWQFDGGHDEMHEWLDGVLQTGVDVVEQAGGCSVAWKGPTFDKVYLGWRHAQPSSIDTEMWMDDVVLHTARVGCPGPP
jgi:hypothetical protein